MNRWTPEKLPGWPEFLPVRSAATALAEVVLMAAEFDAAPCASGDIYLLTFGIPKRNNRTSL